MSNLRQKETKAVITELQAIETDTRTKFANYLESSKIEEFFTEMMKLCFKNNSDDPKEFIYQHLFTSLNKDEEIKSFKKEIKFYKDKCEELEEKSQKNKLKRYFEE